MLVKQEVKLPSPGKLYSQFCQAINDNNLELAREKIEQLSLQEEKDRYNLYHHKAIEALMYCIKNDKDDFVKEIIRSICIIDNTKPRASIEVPDDASYKALINFCQDQGKDELADFIEKDYLKRGPNSLRNLGFIGTVLFTGVASFAFGACITATFGMSIGMSLIVKENSQIFLAASSAVLCFSAIGLAYEAIFEAPKCDNIYDNKCINIFLGSMMATGLAGLAHYT